MGARLLTDRLGLKFELSCYRPDNCDAICGIRRRDAAGRRNVRTRPPQIDINAGHINRIATTSHEEAEYKEQK